MGKISFSLYLFHPFIVASHLFKQWKGDAYDSLTFNLVASIVGASGSYYLIEVPTLFLTNWICFKIRNYKETKDLEYEQYVGSDNCIDTGKEDGESLLPTPHSSPLRKVS